MGERNRTKKIARGGGGGHDAVQQAPPSFLGVVLTGPRAKVAIKNEFGRQAKLDETPPGWRLVSCAAAIQ